MRERSDAFSPWGKASLAILPGIFALDVEIGLWQRLFHVGIESVWMSGHLALFFLCTSLCLIGFLCERQFPTWSFPALGIVLAHLSMGATTSLLLLVVWIGIVAVAIRQWHWHRLPGVHWEAWLLGLILVGSLLYPLTIPHHDPGPPYQQVLATLTMPVAVSAILGILPAMIGLLLARRASVLAGLVFVGSAFVVWEGVLDPEYALLLWTDNTTVETLVSIHPQSFFLMIVPVWVMCVRSDRARIVGFLLPVFTALISTAAIGSVVRPYDTFAHSVVFDFLLILMPLTVVIIIYGRKALHTRPSLTDIVA